jgi:hypothetical protein
MENDKKMTNEELKDKIEALCPLIDEVADELCKRAYDDKTPNFRDVQLYLAYKKAVEARHELMDADLHYID